MKRHLTLFAIIGMAATLVALSPVHAMDNTKVDSKGPDLAAVRAHIKKEDYQQAIGLLEPLAKSHPNSADVFNLLGFSQRKTRKFDASLRNYLHALKLDPKHLGAHVYIGELYIETGKLEKAAEHARIVASLCPSGCKPREEIEAAITKAKNW